MKQTQHSIILQAFRKGKVQLTDKPAGKTEINHVLNCTTHLIFAVMGLVWSVNVYNHVGQHVDVLHLQDGTLNKRVSS